MLKLQFLFRYFFQRGKLVSSLNRRDDADVATVSTPVVNERSPLIQNATSPPPLIADTSAFDNVAVVTDTTSASSVDRKSTDTPPQPDVSRSGAGKEASNKKRKVLSIVSRQRLQY